MTMNTEQDNVSFNDRFIMFIYAAHMQGMRGNIPFGFIMCLCRAYMNSTLSKKTTLYLYFQVGKLLLEVNNLLCSNKVS